MEHVCKGDFKSKETSLATEKNSPHSSTKMSTDNLKSTPKRIGCRHYILAPCLLVYIFAMILASVSITQYIVMAIHKMRYPNEAKNLSSNEGGVCGRNISTPEYRHQEKVQQEAAQWSIYSSLTINIPSIISNLILGSYIDKFGRKLLILLTFTGFFLKILGFVLGIYYQINIYYFLFFNFVDGISGMWCGALSASFAIVADITEPGKTRSFAITLIEMCLGIGSILGSVVSGYIIESFGFIYSIGLGGAVVFLDMIVVAILLPETLEKNTSSKVKVGLFQNIKQSLGFYFIKSESITGKRWKYIICLIIFTLITNANVGAYGIRLLYLLNSPFCWSAVVIGWYLAATNAFYQFVGMGLIKLLHVWFADHTVAFFGTISSTAYLILMGLASTNISLYIAVVIGIGSNVVIPMMRGIMSAMTSSENQGALFASIAAMEAICSLTGSVAANGVYTATVAVYRGIAFFVCGSFSTLAFILTLILMMESKGSDKNLKEEKMEMTQVT